MVNRGVGVGGCDNVLDEYSTGRTELIAVVNMLQIFFYGQKEIGWGAGGDNVLDEYNTGPTELVPNMLHMLSYSQREGSNGVWGCDNILNRSERVNPGAHGTCCRC